jgi:hypothetical protein
MTAQGIDAELQSVKYRTVEAEFRDKSVEVVATELAKEDLNTYYKALDRLAAS